MRQLGPAVALLCLTLAGDAFAQAGGGTATLRFTHERGRGGEPLTIANVRYVAHGRQRNELRVSVEGSDVVLVDTAGVTPGAGCSRPTPADVTVVRCPLRGVDGATLRVSLRDGDDRAAVVSILPHDESGLSGTIHVDGGPGRDELGAGPASGVLDGGSGGDRLAAGTGAVELRGGAGDDHLTGGPVDDVFDEGSTTSGSDTIAGGEGNDRVDYGRRGHGVRADLEGDRDDGQPGERDLIGTDVERLVGGRGNDRLSGDDRANRLDGNGGADRLAGRGGDDELQGGSSPPRPKEAGDRLSGGAGDDTVWGSTGDDAIVPGPGSDVGFTGPGRDRVNARDGSVDEIECGPGGDTVRLDRDDFLSDRGCRRVRRPGPPIAAVLSPVARRHATRPRAILPVGCPGDARRRCRGTVAVVVDGRRVGSTAFAVRRAPAIGQLAIPLERAVWERVRPGAPVQATFALAARDARGRVVRRAYPGQIVDE